MTNRICASLRGVCQACRLVLLLLVCAGFSSAQLGPDQAGEMLLASAQRAYNEQNYAFAAARFREFLARHGNHKDVPAARYGLALTLLDGPDQDYKTALEQLQPLANRREFPDYPQVLYHVGLAQRGLALKELDQVRNRPQDLPQRQAAARPRFEDAARRFGEAATAFAGRAKAGSADTKELPLEVEWSIRCRCDQAEALLRLQQSKEALAAVADLLKQPSVARSRYRELVLYYHGVSSFFQKDYVAAGRSLNQLTPFSDPATGTHARYLLARVHHQGDERPEAAAQYEGVLTDFAKHKQAAAEALKRPESFKKDASKKAFFETLARETPPDHVARALYYLGILRYEDGRFADAMGRLTEFLQQFPNSSFATEARLQQGTCQVQLKQFADALRTLPPLVDRAPHLADQVLFWIGRAQAGAADPSNAPASEATLRAALETYRRAAERAQQLGNSNPESKRLRGEVLVELGDTQQRLRQYREAAATYALALAEKAQPEREQELLLRQLTALQLAGEYVESDKVCQRFQQAFPKSTLLPAVLFRHAENAAFLGQKPADEGQRLREEAIRRYQAVLERFPEFAEANLARYGLALVLHRKGAIDKARQVLEAVPQGERTGELAAVSYLLADCLMRLTPTRADDALAAGQVTEQLKTASELLDAFLAGQPTHAHAPDALLKLGLCHQRMANVLAQPPEKAKSLAAARAAYERIAQQFPKHAAQPQAVFERAKCLALAGDRQGAINELRRFTQDPLRNAGVAPLAVLRLSLLLREQNKAQEAASLLAQCRQQHEQNLARDAERAHWVALLTYHHGMALKEAGKLVEARGLFEQVVKQSRLGPEAAEAGLRFGQCLKEEGLARLQAGRKARGAAGKPDEIAAADRLLEEGTKMVQEAVRSLETHAEKLKDQQPAVEVRARLLYEAAWGYRLLAENEVAAARQNLKPPTISLPLQPSEQKARGLYQQLLAGAGDLPLANDARLELAELYAQRGEHDAAVKLLNEALDREPPAELTERIRLRLGTCHVARKDMKAALAQFAVLAQDPKSPLAGQAHLRAGECLLELGQHTEAVKQLAVFRDRQPFQNQAGLADRALLRLGHALAHLSQWDQSRQAFELLLARYGNSPWAHEARYGVGWACQHQKQYDRAVDAYSQVTSRTATPTAAKAQLQIGLCRLEQQRFAEATVALLAVPFTYDYPELTAAALCEAARAHTALKQRAEAAELLQRVLRDHAESKWADVARERLRELK